MTDAQVRVSREFMDQAMARDDQGNRVHIRWGQPGADGFHEPLFETDYSDTLALTDDERQAVATYRETRAMLPDTDGVVLLVQVVPINRELVNTEQKRVGAELAARRGASTAMVEWLARQAVASVAMAGPPATTDGDS